VVQTWPNSRQGHRMDPMVIVPGTAPEENEMPALVRM
jgi:hypothetical protein